jgi:hypothetical protein
VCGAGAGTGLLGFHGMWTPRGGFRGREERGGEAVLSESFFFW